MIAAPLLAAAEGALFAGAFVNLHNASGGAAARLADASQVGRHAHGYVLVDAAPGDPVLVYPDGLNVCLTNLEEGQEVYLSAEDPGEWTTTTFGCAFEQKLGTATNETTVDFKPGPATPL